jgi:hypothetical protein
MGISRRPRGVARRSQKLAEIDDFRGSWTGADSRRIGGLPGVRLQAKRAAGEGERSRWG